jgi:hypothetical protein
MYLPTPVRFANALLTYSKYSHDAAITTLTSTTECLFTHDIPGPVRDVALDVLSQTVLWGDRVGNFILQMYVVLIHLVG